LDPVGARTTFRIENRLPEKSILVGLGKVCPLKSLANGTYESKRNVINVPSPDLSLPPPPKELSSQGYRTGHAVIEDDKAGRDKEFMYETAEGASSAR
jgi:hypothetical protein